MRSLEWASAREMRADVLQRIAMGEELRRAEEIRALLCGTAMRGIQLLCCEKHGHD